MLIVTRTIALAATAALPALFLAACESPTSVSSGQANAVPAVEGAVVAAQTCAGCHGADYRGANAVSGAPSLEVVLSYSKAHFDALLTLGRTQSGHPASDAMLATVSGLSVAERDAVYDYLNRFFAQEPAACAAGMPRTDCAAGTGTPSPMPTHPRGTAQASPTLP